ncbi:ABC transporter ATP-binding protein [Candidatus Bathyarchaeota archaeon]|nr:MAG: ABC transporter ATP-binding protein [Candidatus Bathyarchaeota archaeon]
MDGGRIFLRQDATKPEEKSRGVEREERPRERLMLRIARAIIILQWVAIISLLNYVTFVSQANPALKSSLVARYGFLSILLDPLVVLSISVMGVGIISLMVLSKPKGTLRKLFSYLRPHWPYVLAIGIAMAASDALNLAQPWIIGFLLFGNVIALRNIAFLPTVIALLGGAFFAKQILDFVDQYLTEILASKTVHGLRTQVYQHIQHLPVQFLDHSRSGELISRVMSDTNEIESVLTSDLSALGANFGMVAGASVLLFYASPRIALTVVPFIIGMVIVVNLFKRRIKRASRRIREAVGDLSARAYEVMSNLRIVKSFTMEEEEAKGFRNKSLAIVKSNIAFLGLLDKMFSPLIALSKSNFKFQKATAAGDRIFEITETKPEVLDVPGAYAPPEILGRIEFDGVSFKYERNQTVLDNFSLTINPGETIAIVGPSGAGKSTIVHLLLRFYEPDAGAIRIDGYPINALKLSYLRKNIGLVIQDPILFSGSVRDNIAYGKPGAGQEEIIQAAKAANAHEFILTLPKGYETEIGERGVTLSVGERQRVSIARALIKDPKILIMDEATSNVDSKSEALIQEAMGRMSGERTTIVIGHRLSTVMDADRIVVLEEGGIAEIGTHRGLLQRQGAYTQLYQNQLQAQTQVIPSQFRGYKYLKKEEKP